MPKTHRRPMLDGSKPHLKTLRNPKRYFTATALAKLAHQAPGHHFDHCKVFVLESMGSLIESFKRVMDPGFEGFRILEG